jgi:hypothetical protein
MRRGVMTQVNLVPGFADRLSIADQPIGFFPGSASTFAGKDDSPLPALAVDKLHNQSTINQFAALKSITQS